MAEVEPDNQKLVHEGWSDITEKKRGCTDILFFLLLIAAWIAMSIIGLIVTGMFIHSLSIVPSPSLPTNFPPFTYTLSFTQVQFPVLLYRWVIHID